MTLKKRFSEEQIIKILKRHGLGEKPKDLFRELGISNQTIYVLKHNHSGMEATDTCDLRDRHTYFSRLEKYRKSDVQQSH